MEWFIFNENGEIISDGFETEREALDAMNNGEYDDGEVAYDVDGIDWNSLR